MREFVGLKPHANPKKQKAKSKRQKATATAKATAKADPCGRQTRGMTNKNDSTTTTTAAATMNASLKARLGF
jgi:hypothetical protein